MRIFSQFQRRVRRLGVPTVNVLGENLVAGVPCLRPNDELVARAAAEHFLERRLEHFAFCGARGLRFSEDRRAHFVAALAAHGHSVHVLEDGQPERLLTWAAMQRRMLQRVAPLAAWLRRLPKPVGLLACNDARACQVSNTCRECGIAVPDEVAIVGVDNDPVLCEMATPPLSSVDPNAARIGYEAAAMLERMIAGHRPAAADNLIEPAGVVARQSTDVLAIPDRQVVDAVRFVHNHACRYLTIDELIEHTGTCRRTLDRWFIRYLGHSVTDEVTRVRIERLKDLLATTPLRLDEIAEIAGFSHPETMHRLFKEACGQTPGEFRKARQFHAANKGFGGRQM